MVRHRCGPVGTTTTRRGRWARTFFGAGVWVWLVAASPDAARALAEVGWSSPEIAWESDGSVDYPVLVTDADDQAHLFFLDRDQETGPYVLMHMPVDADYVGDVRDVLIGVAPGFRVVADASGWLHVLYHGANNTVRYATVEAAAAGDPGAWEPSVEIGLGTPGVGLAMGVGSDVHVCYPRGEAVYHRVSNDWGRAWGGEELVADVTFARIAATVACAVDLDGGVHVAWSEVAPPDYYPSQGVYYSYSAGGGGLWQQPEQVALERYSLPRLAVDAEGTLHFAWQGDTAVGGRYYRQLPREAAGVWSRVETILPEGEGGMSGELPLVFDGLGTVHAAAAADLGIRHVARANGVWSAPVNLSLALEALPRRTNSIERPALTMAAGNLAIAAWEYDFSRIYIVRGTVAAPAVEVGPVVERGETDRGRTSVVPTEAGGSADDEEQRLLATATTPLAEYDRTITESGHSRNLPALVGSVGALLVVILAVLYGRRPRQRAGRRDSW